MQVLVYRAYESGLMDRWYKKREKVFRDAVIILLLVLMWFISALYCLCEIAWHWINCWFEKYTNMFIDSLIR